MAHFGYVCVCICVVRIYHSHNHKKKNAHQRSIFRTLAADKHYKTSCILSAQSIYSLSVRARAKFVGFHPQQPRVHQKTPTPVRGKPSRQLQRRTGMRFHVSWRPHARTHAIIALLKGTRDALYNTLV